MKTLPQNDDSDIGELVDLVGTLQTADGGERNKARRASNARRAVERHLEEKRLREQIEGYL